jgi:hypothetical protein
MAYVDVDELARVLRLRQPSEAQGTAMQRVLDTAAGEINSEIGTSWPSADLASFPFAGTTDPDTGEYIDSPDPLAGALVVEVNLERAVEHWQQQESPFGVIGLGESVPTVTAKDSWDRHAAKLVPLKRSWGIA